MNMNKNFHTVELGWNDRRSVPKKNDRKGNPKKGKKQKLTSYTRRWTMRWGELRMLADEESSKPPGLTEMNVVPQREDREVHPACWGERKKRKKGECLPWRGTSSTATKKKEEEEKLAININHQLSRFSGYSHITIKISGSVRLRSHHYVYKPAR